VAVKKQAATGNRQTAYSARNKAKLIRDAQEILAEIGPSATIEQIVAYAEVSPQTIYNYFESKEQLFLQAMREMWESFLEWAGRQSAPGDRFEMLQDVGRKLLWAKKTHPFYAKILHNTLTEIPDFFIKADQGVGKIVYREMAASGLIKEDGFDNRWVLWTSMYTGLLVSVHVTEELTPAEAEEAYGIGLLVWGVSEARAKKIISRQLEFAPVEE
jgi:AcrR family transcriptional regulator